ncbi:hypothetical protein [Actinomadura gamaensis]|uniref:Uncharacterized protein n=1 Tax=Actinomadura gamaensis TaxID=1763541 RepID=A0ABV9TW56_9ACTN
MDLAYAAALVHTAGRPRPRRHFHPSHHYAHGPGGWLPVVLVLGIVVIFLVIALARWITRP